MLPEYLNQREVTGKSMKETCTLHAIGTRPRRHVRGDPPQDREQIRLIVAETYALLRLGVRTLLSGEPVFRIVAETEVLAEALDLARRLRPNLLLLDMALVTADRWDAIRALPAVCRGLRIVAVVAPGHRQHVADALRLGVSGILYKNVSPELAIRCMRRVMAGEYWIGREAVGEVMDGLRAVVASGDGNGNGDHTGRRPDPPQRTFGLTARELDVVNLIVNGSTNQDIAEQLSISIETVKHHLTRIFDKTGVSSRLALSHFAVRNRLATIESSESTASASA